MAGRTYKFLSSVISDVGVKRTENQDAYSISHSRDSSLFIVADGMGGARGGATASTLAASIVGAEAFNVDGSIDVNTFKRTIEEANLAIHSRSLKDHDLKGMGTTIAALAFVENRLLVASVGDSRVYFLRGNDFRQLTKDHTLVQELVESGAIKLEDAASHPISHMLTRSLGPLDKVNVDAFEFELKIETGDRFIICSDGLYNHVKAEELKEIMTKGMPKDICQQLLKMALERGGSDNVTIEVIEALGMNDPSFVFPLPAPGKLEIDLLGQIEQREIGETDHVSEDFAQSDDFLKEEVALDQFDFNEFVSDDETPSDLRQPTVIPPDSPASSKLLLGGALIIAILAFVVHSQNLAPQQNQEKIITKKAKKVFKEPEATKVVEASAIVEPITSAPEVVVDPPQIIAPPAMEPNILEKVEETKPASVSPEVMNRVLDQANSLTVPEAPKVKIAIEQSPPDRPIVWENEEKKIIKLTQQEPIDQKPIEQTLKEQEDKELSTDFIYTGGDAGKFSQVLEEKHDLRRQIIDLDFKLQLLVDGFKEQQESQLIQQAEESKIVLNAIETKLIELEQELISWKGFDKSYDQTAFMEFLNRRSATSITISQLLAQYQSYEQAYRDAVRAWQNNPRELNLASEMGAKARQKEEFFKSMQQTVKSSTEAEVSKILDSYAQKIIEKENTEELLQATNRRKGFTQAAFTQAAFNSNTARTASMKEQYLAEREKLTTKLDEARKQLPDEKELELHKNIILSKLKAKL